MQVTKYRIKKIQFIPNSLSICQFCSLLCEKDPNVEATHVGIDNGVAHSKWTVGVLNDSTEGRSLVLLLVLWSTAKERHFWIVVAPKLCGNYGIYWL